jgi:RHS repeat-associated protein
MAEVASASDYYPGGMQMPSRFITASNTNYRYGFNGKENDKDASMDGNNYDYGFRIYNPQIGRFLSVDPLMKDFAFYSPYQFAGNSPIAKLDLDGREPLDFKEKWEHKPLFDLNKQKKINENAFWVEDPKLGKVDPQIIYDQVKRQHFIVAQDDQGKNYYLKNDDGNTSVMTINPETHEIKGGHFAEFETQNQAQARLTNKLASSIEGIVAASVTAPLAYSFAVATGGGGLLSAGIEGSKDGLILSGVRGSTSAIADIAAQKTVDPYQSINWWSVGINFIGGATDANIWTTAAGASVVTNENGKYNLQLDSKKFTTNFFFSGAAGALTGGKAAPWHPDKFTGLKEKAAASILGTIPNYWGGAAANAATNGANSSSEEQKQSPKN